MSEKQSNWDLIWYVTGRVSAVVLVVMAVLIAVRKSDDEAKSAALALAVHHTYVAQDLRTRPLHHLMAASSGAESH